MVQVTANATAPLRAFWPISSKASGLLHEGREDCGVSSRQRQQPDVVPAVGHSDVLVVSSQERVRTRRIRPLLVDGGGTKDGTD